MKAGLKFYNTVTSKRTLWLLSALVVWCVLLTSCSLGDSNSNTKATVKGQATPVATALAQLHWCDKQTMIFRDKKTNKTLTDWAIIKPALGFDVYLPEKLPAGSCLVSASGTLNDPIFGSSFTIGYLLFDHSSISLSQAPLRSQSITFQCNPTSTSSEATKSGTADAAQGSVQLCSGAREKTNIVFSSKGNTEQLQQFFNALKSGVDWVPGE